ncbi:NAD(P)/FAD-dependent oxidoreductase [Fulvivirga sediminis]|uniref:NAD(P)/FAD-dependent oxidoreductase n=1 Tax=Fulvivirga sediminis TaxID=2803949 RepID=A0A937F7A6_9BACT|nr:NAD(P)/FAD-dependent oxidoreductase [Fulvivirga sediminis]MBL3656347.1 NAD(P)/FAD-dependent oxidoreductase [Fulvivirga sediminis]
MKNENIYDVIIIGGSYAGLSAAMSLGRASMRTLIIDAGKPCNRQTPYSHNFITHDGTPPAEISQLARNQVLKYDTISFQEDMAVSGRKIETGFEITTEKGRVYNSSKLVIASGMKDLMPEIKGFKDCWGISVIHCPYCHGYEYKGSKTGLFMNGEKAIEHALFINHWAGELTLFTNGTPDLPEEGIQKLKENNIAIVDTEITELVHHDGKLQHLQLADGQTVELEALYAALPMEQQSTIPEMLSCNFSEGGHIEVNDFKQTSVTGVFAAGDNSSPMRSVANAVAAGNVAGAFISKEIIAERYSK